MQLCMAHLSVVSNVQYVYNSASGFENCIIIGPKTMIMCHRLLSFADFEHRRPPKDAPCEAAYFTYKAINCQINIGGLHLLVCLKNRRFRCGKAVAMHNYQPGRFQIWIRC
jgi:hypothetical protein